MPPAVEAHSLNYWTAKEVRPLASLMILAVISYHFGAS